MNIRLPTMVFLPLFLLCFLYFNIQSSSLSAREGEKKVIDSPTYEVDASFLLADLKFSEKRGVKICEIQHGVLSTFSGDKFSHGEPGIIPVNFYHTLSQYFDRSWAISNYFAEIQIRKLFEQAPEWSTYNNIALVEKDPKFQYRASLPVYDPYDINSYHGFLVTRVAKVNDYLAFKKKYPGIILLDAAARSYWIDKHKMTQLFLKNKTLASYKPKCELYRKKYSKSLAREIIEEIQSEIFVIKPRGAFHGKGVIIVDRENLDSTLKYILKRSSKLKKDPDPSYNHWYRDKADSFLVEEFVESDPISIAHLDNRVYQPTMRVAFLLVYSNNQIDVKFLGGYWMLPESSLSEKGTLNNKHKACCKGSYYCKIDPQVMSKVEQQLNIALPLLYEQMLLEP